MNEPQTRNDTVTTTDHHPAAHVPGGCDVTASPCNGRCDHPLDCTHDSPPMPQRTAGPAGGAGPGKAPSSPLLASVQPKADTSLIDAVNAAILPAADDEARLIRNACNRATSALVEFRDAIRELHSRCHKSVELDKADADLIANEDAILSVLKAIYNAAPEHAKSDGLTCPECGGRVEAERTKFDDEPEEVVCLSCRDCAWCGREAIEKPEPFDALTGPMAA